MLSGLEVALLIGITTLSVLNIAGFITGYKLGYQDGKDDTTDSCNQ